MLIVFVKLAADIGVTLLVRMMEKNGKKKRKVVLAAAVRYVGDVNSDAVADLYSYPSGLERLEWGQTRLQRDHAREDGNGSEVGSSREHEESSRARGVERAEMSADVENRLVRHDLIPSRATRSIAPKIQ